MSDRETDDFLMAKIQRGDTLAFDTLVTRHTDQLVGWFYSRTKLFEESCDMAQDVFLKIFTTPHAYSIGTSFVSWMMSVARNRLTDYYRKTSTNARRNDGSVSPNPKRGQVVFSFVENDGDGGIMSLACQSREPDPQLAAEKAEHDAETKELCEMVLNAIDSLPTSQKCALVLRANGVSLASIAKTLSCPQETVHSRLRLARTHVRNLLGAQHCAVK